MSGQVMNAGEIEWISFRFRDLEEDELFWMSRERSGDVNPSYRKLDDTTAMNLRTREVIDLTGNNPQVYQKDY